MRSKPNHLNTWGDITKVRFYTQTHIKLHKNTTNSSIIYVFLYIFWLVYKFSEPDGGMVVEYGKQQKKFN